MLNTNPNFSQVSVVIKFEFPAASRCPSGFGASVTCSAGCKKKSTFDSRKGGG